MLIFTNVHIHVVKVRDNHPGYELAELGKKGPHRKSGSNKFCRQNRTSGLSESAPNSLTSDTNVTSLNERPAWSVDIQAQTSVTCLRLPGRRPVVLYHHSRLSFVVCTTPSAEVKTDPIRSSNR